MYYSKWQRFHEYFENVSITGKIGTTTTSAEVFVVRTGWLPVSGNVDSLERSDFGTSKMF